MKITIKTWGTGELENNYTLREESGTSWYAFPASDSLRETMVMNNLWIEMSEFMTKLQVRETLSRGIPKMSFEKLREVTALTMEQLCEAVRVPYRTLARRDLFKPEESDRIFRVAMVFQTILDVMGDLESARGWFTQPKRALGGVTPLKCCDTEVGAGEVIDLLVRIEHGVFS